MVLFILYLMWVSSVNIPKINVCYFVFRTTRKERRGVPRWFLGPASCLTNIYLSFDKYIYPMFDKYIYPIYVPFDKYIY